MVLNNQIFGAVAPHIKDSKGAAAGSGPLTSVAPLPLRECQTSGCASPSHEGLPPPCLLLVVGANHDQLAVAQCG